MIKREIVENVNGAAMGREGSVKCPRSVDVTRNGLAVRCLAVVANIIDEEIATVNAGRFKPRCSPLALPHDVILTLCDSTTVDHWLALWVGCWKSC
jgi:hypothetical protein